MMWFAPGSRISSPLAGMTKPPCFSCICMVPLLPMTVSWSSTNGDAGVDTFIIVSVIPNPLGGVVEPLRVLRCGVFELFHGRGVVGTDFQAASTTVFLAPVLRAIWVAEIPSSESWWKASARSTSV